MTLLRLTFVCMCIVLGSSSPTRRQYIESTSSGPVSDVPSDDSDWDKFDLDEKNSWLNEIVISPSPLPLSSDYEDYIDDDDDDLNDEKPGVVGSDDDENDIEHQDGEEEDEDFRLGSPRDNRLLLQDDDEEQGGHIKVRHTSKNSYPDPVKNSKSAEYSSQFDFTIEEDDSKGINDIDDDGGKTKSDFILEDDSKDNSSVIDDDDAEDDDEEEDEDGNLVNSDDSDDPLFETPEEESQVMYGDHVFLY